MPSEEFKKLLEIMEKLQNGDQWYQAQTILSVKEDVLGEVEELKDAVEKEDFENIKEEIGDVIWATVLMAKVAQAEGKFNLEDSLKEINEKMVRRHPHVFGSAKATTVEEACRLVEEEKMKEKKKLSGPTQN